MAALIKSQNLQDFFFFLVEAGAQSIPLPVFNLCGTQWTAQARHGKREVALSIELSAGTCTPLWAPSVYMDVHSQMKHFLKLLPEGAGKLDKMHVQSHHASCIKLGLGSPVQYLAATVDRRSHSVAYKKWHNSFYADIQDFHVLIQMNCMAMVAYINRHGEICLHRILIHCFVVFSDRVLFWSMFSFLRG